MGIVTNIVHRALEAPAVRGTMASVDALARDSRLVGRLASPHADALPTGVLPRRNVDDVRLLSVNLHMGVPDGIGLDPANEHLEALRDIARFIDGVDPDIVFVQELRNRPSMTARPGVPEQASVFGRLIGANDMAFTPAITNDPLTSPLAEYGTGAYARNGFTIERPRNVLLPPGEPGIERRSVGIGDIHAPDGTSQLQLGWTHLANRPVEDAATRAEQLQAITRALDAAAQAGGSRRMAIGGDLNQLQGPSDAALGARGFVHANEAMLRTDPAATARVEAARRGTAVDPSGYEHRIDHVYVRDADVSDVAVLDMPPHEYRGGMPTDHRAVLVDLPRARG